ncbi:hypothetical protein ORI20_26965 [Mycobacterium sp. CVI_P3]|uniref:DUF2029 domain-containing protein n=1 Tax=Mycobacterium pinniadriaticum TaxID=2994102 RepID=A0ABT3SLE1_9MYCO|nr:hypothetical protein [Mycobacterium pinniadriaticum]MCX2933917.1 hypothetical protein [Mycobacterium pinniadriaticum]MCX2940339.1 hypothetical protein [Mycobacterium pinniadriaticum]
MTTRRRFVYAIVGMSLLLYTIIWVAFASVFEPNLQFFSYYAINYDQGFIRRGLAGEVLDLFPRDLYFTGLALLRWLVPALFVASIAAAAWTAAARFGRSERRLMLALIFPMLPFGIARAVLVPTPDLLGEAALAVFAIVLVSTKRDGSVVIASVIYGITTAVLTLIHEAIPFLQALGAVLAIAILAPGSTKMRRTSLLVAVTPSLVAALAIALLGRRDASPQCARLPHRAIDFPIALSPDQVLRGEHAYTDYHEWTCRFISVTTRNSPLGGLSQTGWTPWVGAMLVGFAIFAVTVLFIRGISSVSLADFRQVLNGWFVWITLAVILLLPVFATTSDWPRWWVAISFDVAVVYVLYASRRSESSCPATRRTRFFFAAAMVFLALVPIAVGVNAGKSVKPLLARCDQLANDPKWVGICP